MISRFLVLAGLALVLVGSGACSDYVTAADSGTGNGDGAVRVDKGAFADLGVAGDAGTGCGPGIYPCGPYGTQKGETVENYSFVAFTDPDTFCKRIKDQEIDFGSKKTLSFASWYRPPEGCPTNKKPLLWVMVSAGWCGPCRSEVLETMDAIRKDQFDDRIALVDILFEDDAGGPVTETFARTWRDKLGMTFPLLLDPSFKMGKYFEAQSVPFNMLVDLETMKIFFRQTGQNLPAIGDAIQAFLTDK